MPNKARIFSTAVRIGGQALSPMSWSYDLHAYSAADECRVTIPLRETLAALGDLQALTQKTVPLEIQILGGFTDAPGKLDGLPVLFAGPVDCADAHFSKDEYEVTARSWAYQLLGEKTTLIFQNMATDAVAQALAAKHGLAYDNGGAPSNRKAGKIFGDAQAKSTRKLTEWDLLVNLARAEDREVYVVGRTLYYVPTNPEEDPAKGPDARWTLWWSDDGEQVALGEGEYALDDLSCAHYAQFSHDAKVVVINHDPQTGQVQRLEYGSSDYQADASKKRRGGAQAQKNLRRRKPTRQVSSLSAPVIGTKEIYTVSVHGKTPQQVQDIAYARFKEIAKHELVATAELEGTPAFGVRDVYAIKGTGTLNDTTYRVKKLALAFHAGGAEGGASFATTLTLANHVPQPTGEAL